MNTITRINLGNLIGLTTAKILAVNAVFLTAFDSTCLTITMLLVRKCSEITCMDKFDSH